MHKIFDLVNKAEAEHIPGLLLQVDLALLNGLLLKELWYKQKWIKTIY